MTKSRRRICVRLPDGYKLAISNRAKDMSKKTGMNISMSDVVLAAIKSWVDSKPT